MKEASTTEQVKVLEPRIKQQSSLRLAERLLYKFHCPLAQGEDG